MSTRREADFPCGQNDGGQNDFPNGQISWIQLGGYRGEPKFVKNHLAEGKDGSQLSLRGQHPGGELLAEERKIGVGNDWVEGPREREWGRVAWGTVAGTKMIQGMVVSSSLKTYSNYMDLHMSLCGEKDTNNIKDKGIPTCREDKKMTVYEDKRRGQLSSRSTS